MWMLWPVLKHRRLFIAAMCAGFVAGNLSQFGHAIGLRAGIEWLTWPRLPDRNSGWWDPVVGGSLLVGTLGLHLAAVASGRGRTRWIGLAGSAVTLLAIGATGTRGAWIAAIGLTGLVISWAILRLRPWMRMLRGAAIAVIACAVLGAAAWWMTGASISRRAEQARIEIDAALRRGDFSTDTGARVQMGAYAIRAVRTHPLRGIGAGGFRGWMISQVAADGHNPAGARLHAHAHSAPLHIAATTGIIGLLLATLAAVTAVRGAFAEPDSPGGYDLGPGFALIGLFLAGLFDPVHLNAQTGAMLFTLMGLCLWPRPRER